jgi:hypothetical protein
MSEQLNPRRVAAGSFFEALENALRADDVLADRRCVQMIVDKAQADRAVQSRKRFDPRATFCHKVLFDRMDDFIANWCRRRELHTDPYTVFRFEGRERGPTQHETGLGPSLPLIDRAFRRLAESVPEIPDVRAKVSKRADQTIAPALRFQHPLPFGAAGEVVYDGGRADLERGVYLVAMYAATGGDPSRGWRYDCGLLVLYAHDSPRDALGPDLWAVWPEVRERLWSAGRVWVILL